VPESDQPRRRFIMRLLLSFKPDIFVPLHTTVQA
jgi:hypothetical protein